MWAANVEGIAVGDTNYRTIKQTGFIISTSTAVLMPSDYYSRFVPLVTGLGANPPTDSQGFVRLGCSSISMLPKVKLLFGGYWVEMLP